jgi:hypothetical protein
MTPWEIVMVNGKNPSGEISAATCSKCGKSKDLSCFHKNNGKPSGRESWCKACVSIKKKRHRLRKIRSACYLGQFDLKVLDHPEPAAFVNALKPIIEDIVGEKSKTD